MRGDIFLYKKIPPSRCRSVGGGASLKTQWFVEDKHSSAMYVDAEWGLVPLVVQQIRQVVMEGRVQNIAFDLTWRVDELDPNVGKSQEGFLDPLIWDLALDLVPAAGDDALDGDSELGAPFSTGRVVLGSEKSSDDAKSTANYGDHYHGG